MTALSIKQCDELLVSWAVLNGRLGSLTEAQVRQLLNREQVMCARPYIMTRLAQRIGRMVADKEVRRLLSGDKR